MGAEMTVRILKGDCRDVLKTLQDESVHCVVTSPPYWGLRDYGVAGQIGLEPALHEYVETMRQVFADVRRVLRRDGTMWLNLGDSYASSGKSGVTFVPGQSTLACAVNGTKTVNQTKGRAATTDGMKAKDLIGVPWRVAFALQAPYEVPTCVKLERDRAWLAAILDGEGCIGIRRFDSYREDKQQVYQNGFVVYTVVTNNDVPLLDRCIEITEHGKTALKQAADSTDDRGIVSRRDSYGWRLDGNKAVDVIRAAYPFLIAKRRQACIGYTLDQLNKNGHGSRSVPMEIQEKKKLLWELIKRCNQREAVDLPSWVQEPKPEIQPGWYLRSDIIWSKPNPMPESVTDRPTKAHEYLFLLAKSERYFYDAEAIKEDSLDPDSYEPRSPRNPDKRDGDPYFATKVGDHANGKVYAQRNRRTVWEITTSSFPEAHFATFPPALIEPCIKAGCPMSGTVLDPFGGAGTTGLVADRLGRNAILIELNPEYADMAERRIRNDAGMFAELSA